MSSEKIVDLRGKRALFFYRQRPPVDKRVPLRERKRKLRLIALTVLFLIFAVGAFGLHYVSYMGRFSVNSIEVKGAATIDPGVIRQYVDHVLNDGPRHYLSRSNIFLYPRSVIEKDIVIDFPRIKSATLSRPSFFSTTLIVTVQERTFFALWCPDASKQGCYQMDDSGYIFAEAAVDNPAKYIFGGGLPSAPSTIGQVFAPSHLSEIIALLERFTQAAYIPEGAIVENPRDFSVPLKDRFIIKASFDMDPDTLIKNLQLILSNPPLRGNERNIAYIDLRFGDRVYYKMKGDTPVPQAQ